MKGKYIILENQDPINKQGWCHDEPIIGERLNLYHWKNNKIDICHQIGFIKEINLDEGYITTNNKKYKITIKE
jgi:hypothetical protein